MEGVCGWVFVVGGGRVKEEVVLVSERTGHVLNFDTEMNILLELVFKTGLDECQVVLATQVF